MASRRKSKPARRVDSICSKLTGFGNPADFSNSAREEEPRTGNSQPNDRPSVGPISNDNDRLDGVYVIEPESVSDGEGPIQKKRPEFTALNSNDMDARETSHSAETPTPIQSQPSAGLDLSVKRPKYDTDYASDAKSESATPMIHPSMAAEQVAGLNAISEEQLRKYQELTAMLESGKNIMDAMQEVGLTTQQFFTLHWLSQLSNPESKKEPPMDGYQDNAPPPLSREDFIQQQKQMAASSQMSQHSNTTPVSESKLPAPLYDVPDVPNEDPNERLKNLFMQTYSLMTQNGSPSLSPIPSRSADCRSLNQSDSLAAGTVSSGVGSIKRGTLDPATFDQEVFDQYITKFTSANRCGLLTCQYYTRDHYHCVVEDCNYQRFTNKADVIRHYNMHKKRDNSLAHGFLRFSPSDDCSSKYPNCTHNGKSTHYHCMQPDCNKVYTSTSDVMTHENFHKKYMQFVCSGFKRFRATEQCDLESCVFRNQKTTHFHCTRNDCNFTFKNKCDIEKHKTYHQRDDHFVQRGFKKYYKNEPCGIVGCVWSMTSNHLHCLRPGCNFSFTSSGQMESHIRKHDRSDYSGETHDTVQDATTDVAMFNPMISQNARSLLSSIYAVGRNSRQNTSSDYLMDFSQTKSHSTPVQQTSSAFESPVQADEESVNLSRLPAYVSEPSSRRSSPSFADPNADTGRRNSETPVSSSKVKREYPDFNSLLTAKMSEYETSDLENIAKYFLRCPTMKCLFPACEYFTQEHYHCMVDGCFATFPSEKNVRKHSRFHLNLELTGVSQPLLKGPSTPLSISPDQPARTSMLSVSSAPSRNTTPPATAEPAQDRGANGHADAEMSKSSREEDARLSGAVVSMQGPGPSQLLSAGLLQAMIKSPQSRHPLFSSPSLRNWDFLTNVATSSPITNMSPREYGMDSIGRQRGNAGVGYMHFTADMPCIGADCKYAGQVHWHCTINRCRYVCKSLAKAQNHRTAHDTSEAYSRSAKDCFRSYTLKHPCPNPNCEFRLRGHYHCLKPGCTFVTIGTSKLPWHMKKHEKIANREANGFKYYTKKEHCRHIECKYAAKFSHYHCVRDGCSSAFQYIHQMSTHIRKHNRKSAGRSWVSAGELERDERAESGDDATPLVIDEEALGAINFKQEAPNNSGLTPREIQNAISHYQNVVDQSRGDITLNHDGKALDFSTIIAMSQQAEGIASQIKREQDNSDVTMDEVSDDQSQAARYMNNELSGAEISPMMASGIGQFSKFKLDDATLEGFQKFETNQDCGDQSCVHRHKVAHFHCTKDNCNYHFTGRSHMYKHYQHHERVAGLVRDDFKRFKATQPCDDARCTLNGNSTHFHCLRCEFRCTDSAKVGTHRRQHMKADVLQQSGFKRVRGKEDCGVAACKYRFRTMSHFHCLQPGCSYGIVGLSGIELHAEKHKRGLLQARQSKPISASMKQEINLFNGQLLTQNQQDRTPNSSMADVPSSSNDGSDNGHSDRSSPALPAEEQQGQALLSKFAMMRSGPARSPVVATSPVSSNSLGRVTEGVSS